MHLQKSDITADHQIVSISAKESKNISLLLQTIYETLPHTVKLTFRLPLRDASQAFISQLYNKTQVLNVTYDEYIIIEVECNEKIKEKLIAASRAINGTVVG